MSEGVRRRQHEVEDADDEPRSAVRPVRAPVNEGVFLREAAAIEHAVRRALGLLPGNDPS